MSNLEARLGAGSPVFNRPHSPEQLGALAASMKEVDERIEQMRFNPQAQSRRVEMVLNGEGIKRTRFSQLTIEPTIRDGQTVHDLATTIYNDGVTSMWRKEEPIHLVRMPDGELTSLDNRRLYALKLIAEQKPDFDLKVTAVVDFEQDQIDPMTKGAIFTRIAALPPPEHNAVHQKLNVLATQRIITAGTYGHGIVARMNGLSSPRREFIGRRDLDDPKSTYGFSALPTVWDNKMEQQFLRTRLFKRA